MVAQMAFRLTFGLLAVVMGCGLILWVCYNEFIHRLPQYSGTHWLGAARHGSRYGWNRSLLASQFAITAEK